MKASYTPTEVADGLMVSRCTIYRWISSGCLRSVKIRNTIRIPREEYERLLAVENANCCLLLPTAATES